MSWRHLIKLSHAWRHFRYFRCLEDIFNKNVFKTYFKSYLSSRHIWQFWTSSSKLQQSLVLFYAITTRKWLYCMHPYVKYPTCKESHLFTTSLGKY
jgi:hypothetical protein